MLAEWQKLGPLEQLMLDDSSGTNACIITAVFNIEGEISTDWVVENVANRLLVHPRFCSVLSIVRGRRPFFLPIPGFRNDPSRVRSHITTHKPSLSPPLPPELDAIVSSPLQMDRPLWELHLFPGKDMTSSAIVFRVHHSIGDGDGLLRFFLLAVTDETAPLVPTASPPLPARRPLNTQLTVPSAIPQILEPVVGTLRDVFTVFVKPLIPDSASVFNRQKPSLRKRAVFARPHALHELAASARLAGISVNDLTLAAVIGALREYALTHGDTPRDLRRFHVGVPVNRHRPGDGVDTVGNAVTPLPLRAPVLQADRVDRLAVSTRRMRYIKYGIQPQCAAAAYGLVRALPRCGSKPLWRRLTRVCSALYTNMAGPRENLRCGGREVTNVRVLAPSQGRAGMTISAFSYAGSFNLGFCCDLQQVAEPDVFANLFNKELDALIYWIKQLD